MPPKIKITKAEIVKTALDTVRKQGEAALNARTIAAELSCSTQPIFSNFSGMEELQKTVYAEAYEMYLGFLKNQIELKEYPTYKSMGMAYINFAKEEKELFKLLFMCDKKGDITPPSKDFNASVEIIMQNNGFSREIAELMHFEMWTCVHGIAVMLATSFHTPEPSLISDMLTDVYMGLRARHTTEERTL